MTMHEYSLVEALVRRVEEEARRRQALAIHGLKVSVGELSGVDPELFRTAYETFRAGTSCASATLEVVTYPAAWSCPACGKAFAKGEVLRCAACDVPARLSGQSDALLLESIDMEVP
jgi:hydrogenase nickel incorporation protein HypA/HybF